MTYQVVIPPEAEKQLNKLDKASKERIIAVLERIRIRPFAFAKRLVGVEYFSVRAGKYRIILDIRKMELVILVIEIGHRKNIYKKI
jgi:mRNA interferase RelE/StbE